MTCAPFVISRLKEVLPKSVTLAFYYEMQNVDWAYSGIFTHEPRSPLLSHTNKWKKLL